MAKGMTLDRDELAAREAAGRLSAGLASEGVKHTRGTDAVVPGSAREAAAAVAASVLVEQAAKTGDRDYADRAADLIEASNGIGAPQDLSDLTPEELDRLNVAPAKARRLGILAEDDLTADVDNDEEPEDEQAPVVRTPVTADDDGEAVAEAPAIDLTPDLPPELAAILAMDDDDDDDEEEEPETPVILAQPSVPEPDYTTTGYEYVDPAVAAVRAENEELRKRLAAIEKRDHKQDMTKWVAEGLRVFPAVAEADLVDLARNASGHRDFLRKAKERNERQAPVVARYLEQERTRIAGERQVAREEERARATEMWGTPVGPPGAGAPQVDMESERKLRIARERGGFAGRMAELIRQGRI